MNLKPYTGDFDPISPADAAPPALKRFSGEFDPLPGASPEKSGFIRRVVGDSAVDLGKGVLGLGEAAVGVANLPTGGLAGKAMESIGYRPEDAKATLTRLYSPERAAANQNVEDAEGFIDTAAAMISNPSTIVGAGIESVPSMLGGGAIARGAATAFKRAVTPALVGLGEGVVGAGSAAEGIRQQTDDGELSVKQALAALGAGTGTALLGAAGGKVAEKLGIVDPDVLAAGGAAAATKEAATKAPGVFRRAAGGAVAEGVLEELPQSAQEQAWSNVALDRPIGEGVPEASAAGLLTGGLIGGGVAAFSRPRIADAPPENGAPTPERLALPPPDGTASYGTIPIDSAGNAKLPDQPNVLGDMAPLVNRVVGSSVGMVGVDSQTQLRRAPVVPNPGAPRGSLSDAANAIAAAAQPAAPAPAAPRVDPITDIPAPAWLDRTTGEFTKPPSQAVTMTMVEMLRARRAADQTLKIDPVAIAAAWGLSPPEVKRAHREALQMLAGAKRMEDQAAKGAIEPPAAASVAQPTDLATAASPAPQPEEIRTAKGNPFKNIDAANKALARNPGYDLVQLGKNEWVLRRAAAASATYPTWDTLKAGEVVTLYRGETPGVQVENGEWWTTDRAKAERFGEVQAQQVRAEDISKYAARGHNGADEFVFPGMKPADLAAKPASMVPDSATPAPAAADVAQQENGNVRDQGQVEAGQGQDQEGQGLLTQNLPPPAPAGTLASASEAIAPPAPLPEVVAPAAAPAAADKAEPVDVNAREVLDSDIVAPSGGPFTIRGAADIAARRAGGKVIEVDGGFVVRSMVKEKDNETDVQAGDAGIEQGGALSADSAAVVADQPQGAVEDGGAVNTAANVPAVDTEAEAPSAAPAGTTLEPVDQGAPQNTQAQIETTAGLTPEKAQTAAPSVPIASEGPLGNATAGEPAVPPVAAAATSVDEAANQAATSPANDRPEPTEAQKEAGNYAKGHVVVNGHDISIENPKGTRRRPEWPPMKHHYGYIRGTVGKDKDHVDVFMTDDASAPDRPVFVIDQNNKDGSFDEHKVVMGVSTEAAARKAYLSNYAKGWTGLGAVTQMTQEEFKAWVRDPEKTKKPAAKALTKQPGIHESTKADDAKKAAADQGKKPATKRDAREIENSVFRTITSNPDMVGKSIEEITNEIRSQTADSPLATSAVDKLARAIAKSLKTNAEELEKQKHRNPAVYKEALGAAVVEAYPSAEVSDDEHGAFIAGWSHALKGKTKSTMSGEHLEHMLKGYVAANRWMKTPAGKAWYEGKPVAKLENTGADLRRWYEQMKAKLLASRSSGEQLLDAMLKSTVRADLFPITPAEGATPGVTRLLELARNETVGFLDYLANWTHSDDNPFTSSDKGEPAKTTFGTYKVRHAAYSPKERAIKFINAVMGNSDTGLSPHYILDRAAPESEWIVDKFGRKHPPARPGSADQARDIILGVASQYMDDVRYLRESLQSVENAKQGAVAAHAFRAENKAAYERLLMSSIAGSWRTGDPFEDGRHTNIRRIIESDTVPIEAAGDRSKPLTPPRLDRVTRTGLKDHRGGKDVTPAKFKETFGFADVGFGKWVNAKQDQDHLNYAYDAFMDLATHFGVSPSAIGGGKMHFTIGSLGHGKYAAHFAPRQPHPDGGSVPVINVTNTKGDGTVYHEWGHAFDMLLAGEGWGKVRIKVLRVLRQNIVTPEHVEANARRFLFGGWYYKGSKGRGRSLSGTENTLINNAVRAVKFEMDRFTGQTSYYKNAGKLDAGKSEKDLYWSNDKEMIARSIEAWVVDTLGGTNTYLVNPGWAGPKAIGTENGYRGTPYPQGDERAVFVKLWNAVRGAVREVDGRLTLDPDAFDAALPKEWAAGAERAKELSETANMEAFYREELGKREKEAEDKRAELEAEADRKAAEHLAELNANAAPPAPSETMGPLGDLDLSAIFDEAAAELREETQEQPTAPAPGEKVAELAEEAKAPPSEALPPGWTESRPGGMATNRDPQTGGIVDTEAGTGRWFAISNRTVAGSGVVAEGLPSREAAFRAIAIFNKAGSAETSPELASLASKQENTAAALAKEAAKQGVTGIDEALKGLVKLFGGGPGRLNSFPSGFDESAYKAAKPHFEAALAAFQTAGKNLKDLFKFLIQNFGDGIKMYAVQFAKDKELGATLGTAPSASRKVADWVAGHLHGNTDPITWRELFEQADVAFGGTQAEGKYTPKDAYDALEAGVNLYLSRNMASTFNPAATTAESAVPILAMLERMTERLPTQSKRTDEMDKFQQFSTVPAFAYMANWVANVNANDVMLEPSAGIGGLAVFAKNAGAKLVLNELSSRRAAVLQEVFPGTRVFQENAEQIDNILPDDIAPSVVVMNPPFSNSATRGATKDTAIGAQHVEQALNRLAPGGRLVAIVGQGMAMGAPTFKAWWAKISAKHDVRAVVPVDGKGYAKYGTTFDNVLLVIDKTAPKAGRVPVTTPAKAYNELVGILTEIRNDRPSPQIAVNDNRGPEQVPAESARDEVADEGGSAPGTGTGAADVVDVGNGQPGVGSGVGGGRGGRSGKSGKGRPGGAQREPGGSGAGNSGGSNTAPGGTGNAAPSGGPSTGVTIESGAAESAALSESVFENYLPQKLRVPGAQPHPGELVQSAAMASVQPPDPTYTPNLPAETITKGLLSIAQVEAVAYAGQAHEQTLPSGERRGFFIGDGTGVGKGREIAGIVLDNIRQGRKKAVWVTEKQGLMHDAKRDFSGIGGDEGIIFNQNKTSAEGAIDAADGIVFTTYSTLRSGALSQDTGDKKGAEAEKKKGQSRLDQLVKWLGADFDGVLVFDEAHNAGNAVPVKGSRGNTEPSAQALAVVELQKQLPKARVVYVSATGATQVANLSYATRLGLWGKDTPFATVMNFIAEMVSGGLATMELVARDMKQMGAYLARSLSFNGVSYSRIEHELDPLQVDIYNRLAEAWQTTLQNFEKALEITGAKAESGKAKNPRAVAAAKSAYWGAQQRFFNQIITSMQMPSVIAQMERDIAAGDALVLQLVNTNEAQMERALSKRKSEDESEDLEDLDLTPRDQLMQMVENSFPVVQMQEITDANGKKVSVVAVDSDGKPVINKEAVRMRDALLSDLKNIRVPDGPLEMVLNHFGPDVVAEVTGRKQRVVRKPDENGEDAAQIEKRGSSAARADADAFMADRKRILLFSDAGGTGFSFHADLKKPNQRKRKHYLIQPGWRADKAVQGFGRTHRTNQKSAPHYYLAATNIPAHKRFLSSIARRLDQLGALTKGQRDTANQGLFSEKDNLESKYAQQAIDQLFKDLQSGQLSTDKIFQPGDVITSNARYPGQKFVVVSDEGGPNLMLRKPDGTEARADRRYVDDSTAGLIFKDIVQQMGFEKIVNPETGKIEEKDVPATSQFLNRMLSLKLDLQEQVFAAFMARMEEKVDVAIQRGELDTGIETIKALDVGVASEDVIYTDSRTKAETSFLELDLTQANTFYPLPEPKYQGGKTTWMVNVSSGRVWLRVESGTKTDEKSGAIYTKYRMMGTGGTAIRDERDFKAKVGADPYREVTAAEAAALWQKENEARPPTVQRTAHMITGALLPIWDRLKTDAKMRVVRTQTRDGRRLLGRLIASADVQEIRARFEISSAAAKLSPTDMMVALLSGKEAKLANGWVLKRVLVSGDLRIEISSGPRGFQFAEGKQLVSDGVIQERINWVDRYFIPTGQAGLSAFEAVVKSRPVMDIVDPKTAKTEDKGDAGGQFSRADGKTAGAPATTVQRAVSAVTKGWTGAAPRVSVLDTAAGLPASAKADPEHATAEGFYDPSTGTVYLIAANLKDTARALQVLAHEAIGHYGMEAITGPAVWAQITETVGKMRANPKHAALFAELNRRYGNLASADPVFVREAVAVMAEKGVQNSVIERMVAALRSFLRKLGFDMKFTDVELRGQIRRAARHVTKGSGQPAVGSSGNNGAMAAYSNRSGTFYSALVESVGRAEGAPKRGNATQWKQWLDGAQRRGEFKQAERDWIGVDAWLDGRAATTREDLAEFVRANQVQVTETVLGGDTAWREAQAAWLDAANMWPRDQAKVDRLRAEYDAAVVAARDAPPAKFEKFQLAGGKNYRELLLTLPPVTQKNTRSRIVSDQIAVFKGLLRSAEEEGDTAAAANFRETIANIEARNPEDAGKASAEFRSTHFEQPNILAHVRFNERTDADGKRVLFVEEVQSDWHQQGRKQGYTGNRPLSDAEADRWTALEMRGDAMTAAERAEYAALDRRNEQALDDAGNPMNGGGRVPDAPLKKEWPLTAMKRMIRLAAENGFDKIAWTTGDQQAERYDLSKQVKTIYYRKDVAGGYLLTIEDKGGETQAIDVPNANSLSEYVGKEIAERIVAGEGEITNKTNGTRAFSGLDLKVGGAGMRAFYDKILPAELNKYVKKWGTMVAMRSVSTTPSYAVGQSNADVHAITITPAMREAAMQGQPLFSAPAMTDDQGMRAVFGALTDIEGSFKYPISQRTAIEDVFADSAKRFKIERKGTASVAFEKDGETEHDAVKYQITPLDDPKNSAYVYVETGGPRMYVDAAEFESGLSGGSEMYSALFNYALNAGKVFIGDPNGLSDEALLRRTELMASAALKFGTTRMMEPHPRQRFPDVRWVERLDWKRPITPEADQANIAALLRTSYNNAKRFMEGLGDVRYSFDRRELHDAGGKPVPIARLDALGAEGSRAFAARPGADPGKSDAAIMGRATVARAVAFQSALREARQVGWPALLARVSSSNAARGVSDPLRAAFYSKPDPGASPISGNEPQILDRMEGLMRSAGPRALEAVKNTVENWRPAWLGALGLRHLAELGQGVLPFVGQYADIVQQIATDRNLMQEEGGGLAEAWQKWASKNRAENTLTVDLMHDSTIAGTDPAEAYADIPIQYGGKKLEPTRKNVLETIKQIHDQIRGRAGDDKTEMLAKVKMLKGLVARNKHRRAQHAQLLARWQNLSPEAKQMYRDVRDLYAKRRNEREAALIQRIKDQKLDNVQERAIVDSIRQQFESARIESPYFPLQRFGEFWIAAKSPEGEPTYVMRENHREWKDEQKALKAAGFEITAVGRKGETSKALEGASAGFVADVITKVKKAGAPTKVQDEIYQMYLQSLPDLSQRKHSIHRKKVSGYSADAIRAFGTNMLHEAHQIARMRHSHVLEGLVDQMGKNIDGRRSNPDADATEIAKADALLGEMKKRHEWIMNPTDSKITNVIGSLGFVYYLGLTPAAALVNLSQTAMTAFPALAADPNIGPIKAMNLLMAAMRDSIKTGGNIHRTLTDPQEQLAYQALRAMGAIDKTQAHNLAGIAEGESAKFSPVWAKTMNGISYLFHRAEIVNREATGMAAFRAATANGMPFDAAVKFAGDTIWTAHFDYSNAARARWMQGNAAKVLLMFRQYSLNMTWFLARNAWQSVKGETPAVRKQALRTLTGVLGMTSLFAGTVGLPVIGMVFAILNAVAASFGSDDEPWDAETEFRNFLADMFGNEAGGILADGPVNAITGADVASRTSMNGLWFRGSDRELEGRDAYFNLLEQAAGPVGGMVKNALVAKQLVDNGHVWRGVETFLPKALKDNMKAVRYGTEGVNNLRGDAMVQDLNVWQTLLQLGGFTPAEVAEHYDANRAIKGYEANVLGRRQRLVDAYAMSVRLEDVASRNDVLKAIAKFNKTFPEIPVTADTIERSLRSRARYSARAEGGIVVNRRIEQRAREAARFATEQ